MRDFEMIKSPRKVPPEKRSNGQKTSNKIRYPWGERIGRTLQLVWGQMKKLFWKLWSLLRKARDKDNCGTSKNIKDIENPKRGTLNNGAESSSFFYQKANMFGIHLVKKKPNRQRPTMIEIKKKMGGEAALMTNHQVRPRWIVQD